MERVKQDWLPFITFVLLGICVLLLFKRCDAPKPQLATIPEQARTDSFRTVIKYHDSVRVKEVVKWRNMTRIKDSVKCYEVLIPFIAQCDTIIRVDSILISSLKGQVSNDSAIIFKQSLMLKADSIHIVKLDKKIRRNRRIALFFGAVSLGAIGTNLSRYR